MGTKLTNAVRKTRVLVVDDHPLVRYALAQLLNNSGDLMCCGEAEGMKAARAAVESLAPDLVLLDLSLGDGDGFDLISEWARSLPSMKMVVISRHDEAVYAERALRIGADGFITKEESPEGVLTAVRLVMSGKLYLSERIAAQVKRRLDAGLTAKGTGGIEALSDRELQVFRMLGEGRNTKEIAAQLGLSPKTIETHRSNLQHKLGLPDSISLIRHSAKWSDRH